LFIGSAPAETNSFHRPTPASHVTNKPLRRYTVISPFAPGETQQRLAFERLLAAGKLQTLPLWSGQFSIQGHTYRYHFVGAAPGSGKAVTIPVVIVPIRLTIPDASQNGSTPVVLDATRIVKHILASPLFQAVPANGNRQLADGMLAAEFPNHAAGWSTNLSATVAPPLDITAPAGTVQTIQSKSGRVLGIVRQGSVINKPIAEAARQYSPHQLPIFITYNALLRSAFGYHSFVFGADKSQAIAYIYSSWLEHVNDALGEPSPDAATLSHEVSETVHDPVLTSRTRKWGDPFGQNRCFDTLIEVGDVIEFAPFKIQYYKEAAMVGSRQRIFTLQNEALLPWFERQTPSQAQGGAYSYPSQTTLTAAAPLDCKK
jgi:hypothetical protein